MFWVGKGQQPDTTDTYFQQVASWQAKAQTSSQQLDSAKVVINGLLHANVVLDSTNTNLLTQKTTLQGKISTTRKQLDSVRTQLEAQHATDTVVDPALQLAEGYRALSDSLQRVVIITEQVITDKDIQIGNLTTGLALMTIHADSLQSVLLHAPTPPKPVKLFGFIPAPSRMTSFLIGALAGTVTAIVVRH